MTCGDMSCRGQTDSERCSSDWQMPLSDTQSSFIRYLLEFFPNVPSKNRKMSMLQKCNKRLLVQKLKLHEKGQSDLILSPMDKTLFEDLQGFQSLVSWHWQTCLHLNDDVEFLYCGKKLDKMYNHTLRLKINFNVDFYRSSCKDFYGMQSDFDGMC